MNAIKERKIYLSTNQIGHVLKFWNKIIGEIKNIIKASGILIIRNINKMLSSNYQINYINDRSGRRSHLLTNDIIMCNN